MARCVVEFPRHWPWVQEIQPDTVARSIYAPPNAYFRDRKKGARKKEQERVSASIEFKHQGGKRPSFFHSQQAINVPNNILGENVEQHNVDNNCMARSREAYSVRSRLTLRGESAFTEEWKSCLRLISHSSNGLRGLY